MVVVRFLSASLLVNISLCFLLVAKTVSKTLLTSQSGWTLDDTVTPLNDVIHSSIL